MTERQLLEGLLIPSGNNIAQLLAATPIPAASTPSTVSTAADQLRVFQKAMRFPGDASRVSPT